MLIPLRKVFPKDKFYKKQNIESLDELIYLSQIQSATQNLAGVLAVQAHMRQELLKLGFKIKSIPHPGRQYADLMVATYNPGAPNKVSMIMHADTVLEPYSKSDIRIIKDKVIGPGVADNKGGIVVALNGLRKFFQNSNPDFCIQLVCSPNEEIGSPGFLPKLKELGEDTDICLGFEPARQNASIISSRNGNRWYNIRVVGKEAHAGRANGEEINSAHELACKITKLLAIREKMPSIKLNIGAIRSSRDKFNVVCGDIEAKLDTRFHNYKDRDLLHEEIMKVLNEAHIFCNENQSAKVEYFLEDDCPPLEYTPKSEKWLKFYQNAVTQAEGRYVQAEHSNGAADINHMSHPGNISIDGLGPVAGGMHTYDEYVELDTIETRSQALNLFLQKWGQECLSIQA